MKKNDNASAATSTSVKDKSYEVSSKKSSVNETQENQSDSDEISINLESSSFKKYTVLIDIYDGKSQWRSIYEVIYDLFFVKDN